MSHPSETQKQATGDRQPATGNEETARTPTPLRIGSNIAQRLIAFATAVIGICRSCPKDAVARHVVQQLVRSATSCGANYEEARAAESKHDFVHKVGIAAKELRETMYWLELIRSASLTTLNVVPIQREAGELSAILGASIRTARRSER